MNRPSSAPKRIVGPKGWVAAPIAALVPRLVAQVCADVAAAAQVDPMFSLLPALATASGAVGRSHVIRLDGVWVESPAIWCALVAPPGAGKSPAAKPLIKPLLDLERDYQATHKTAMERYESEFSAWKGLSRDEKERMAQPVRPVCRRIMVGNTTIEGLTKVLLANQRGVFCYRDELGELIGGLDRYSKGGGGADEAAFCSLWSGAALLKDRASQDDATFIPDPFLSLAGNLTPKGLLRLGKDHADSGLFARFLVAWPDRVPQWYPDDYEPDEPASLVEWRSAITQMGRCNPEVPYELTLDREARKVFNRFRNEIVSFCAPRHDGDPLLAVAAKATAQAARIALTFHCLGEASGDMMRARSTVISAASMARAVLVARWFVGEGARLSSWIHADDAASDPMSAVIEWARTRPADSDGIVRIVARDMMRAGPRPRPRTSGEATVHLQAVVDAGFGRWERGGAKGQVLLLDCAEVDRDSAITADGARMAPLRYPAGAVDMVVEQTAQDWGDDQSAVASRLRA